MPFGVWTHESPRNHEQTRVQLPTPAENVPLLVFTAERGAVAHAAAPLLLPWSVTRRRRCQSISPARQAHSSKPAAAACGGRGRRRLDGWTDSRTDGQMNSQQFHRLCATYYASSVNRTKSYISNNESSLCV